MPSERRDPDVETAAPDREGDPARGPEGREGDGARILGRSEHPISRKAFGANVVKVLYRLHRKGHKAYLVGGSVRDLMLGIDPKDFDVSTDARPQQIRRLFRNSRIIGRRFRLAHVFFKDGIIEVATFRRDPDPEAQQSAPDELLITDDNVFGTPREDAFRRDFTVNALFYNIADFSVIDYVGGIEDLDGRLIRCIGDPDVRLREDPVRMLRACELAGRLDFGIEPATQLAIHRHRHEVEKAAPARLAEEIVQLLKCGHAGKALQWMMDLGLLEVFLPEAYAMVSASERGLGEIGNLLPALDRMVAGGREVADTTLLSALLLPTVLLRRHDVEALDGGRSIARGPLRRLTEETVAPFATRFALSRLKTDRIVRTLMTFHRLAAPPEGAAREAQVARLASFDEALVLLEILTEATGRERDRLERWRRVRKRVPRSEKTAKPEKKPRRRRRRRRRRS